jgi:hypothetical protein
MDPAPVGLLPGVVRRDPHRPPRLHPVLRALLRVVVAPDSTLARALGGYGPTFVRHHLWPQVRQQTSPWLSAEVARGPAPGDWLLALDAVDASGVEIRVVADGAAREAAHRWHALARGASVAPPPDLRTAARALVCREFNDPVQSRLLEKLEDESPLSRLWDEFEEPWRTHMGEKLEALFATPETLILRLDGRDMFRRDAGLPDPPLFAAEIWNKPPSDGPPAEGDTSAPTTFVSMFDFRPQPGEGDGFWPEMNVSATFHQRLALPAIAGALARAVGEGILEGPGPLAEGEPGPGPLAKGEPEPELGPGPQAEVQSVTTHLELHKDGSSASWDLCLVVGVGELMGVHLTLEGLGVTPADLEAFLRYLQGEWPGQTFRLTQKLAFDLEGGAATFRAQIDGLEISVTTRARTLLPPLIALVERNLRGE